MLERQTKAKIIVAKATNQLETNKLPATALFGERDS